MKEIWKLIELLNEYGKEKWNPFDEWGFNSNEELFCKWLSSWYSEILIISKKFWFIKRLIENDKIDLENEELISLMSELWERRNPVKCLLMLLAIQDEPIRFLCEIIK